jgi:hypothetical protein
MTPGRSVEEKQVNLHALTLSLELFLVLHGTLEMK